MTNTQAKPLCITAATIRQFFEALSKETDYAAILGGNPQSNHLNQWLIIGLTPKTILKLQGNTLSIETNGILKKTYPMQTPDDLFELLDSTLKDCICYPSKQPLPFNGGLVTLLGYEFYQWCDADLFSVTPPENKPHQIQYDGLWIEFKDWIVLNLETTELTLLSNTEHQKEIYQTLWQSILNTATHSDQESKKITLDQEALKSTFQQARPSFNEVDFSKKVEEIKRHIVNGNLYQANLSIGLHQTVTLNPFDLYEYLITHNPSPFSGMLKTPEGILISNSPERLVSCDKQGQLETRPIAGTRGRGTTPEEDVQIGETLRNNTKEKAEHLMLVDLERNDLGRIAQGGSVIVDELLTLERYSHVTHLVSNITAQLQPEKNCFDIIKATFPGGTITGCPKIRCIKTLTPIEPLPRKFYTGSLGYLGADGKSMDLNILIRSVYLSPLSTQKATETPDLLLKPAQLGYNAGYIATSHFGAGIVADSIGEHEYRECIRKASSMIGALKACERN